MYMEEQVKPTEEVSVEPKKVKATKEKVEEVEEEVVSKTVYNVCQ